MKNIIRYGIIGIVIILIILFGFNFISNISDNSESNFIDKIMNIDNENQTKVSENISNTVYQYGNSKISYAKSKNVKPFVAQIKNRFDLKQITLENMPPNSIAFKTNTGEYALLILKNDSSEAVFIISPTEKELLEAASRINTGDEILNQLTNKFNNLKIIQ